MESREFNSVYDENDDDDDDDDIKIIQNKLTEL